MDLVALRVPEAWRVKVDLAARLSGLSRSAFVRAAAEAAAERHLARLGPGQRAETANYKTATKRGRRGNPR